MKAYKFLTEGYKAMHGNFQYAVGQTYVHSGDIELREAGFHASKETRDAIQYCNGSHLVEVELGGRIIEGKDKVVASEITISRELDIVKELEILAGDEDWKVRCAVACNPNTPTELFKTLAGNKDTVVRWSVASNPNTLVEILETLASDGDEDVRRAVALNPNTPVEILETLASDGDEDVRSAANSKLEERK